MNENEPFLETEKLQQATKLQKILDMHKDVSSYQISEHLVFS
ncbi:MAG: hypothetical protein WCQ49_03535 [Candidatus Saccharibacteria bacterium]